MTTNRVCVCVCPRYSFVSTTQCATPINETDAIAQAQEDSDNFKKRLRKDLMNRDGHR